MKPKILKISDHFKNSKNEDLNETTIYNQFQLKDEIATNQNLYNINEDQNKPIRSSGTGMKFDKKYLR